MDKKTIKKRNEERIVEKCAALGLLIGSTLWFCIYIGKEGLFFEKMAIYMLSGIILGALIGEIIRRFKKQVPCKNKHLVV